MNARQLMDILKKILPKKANFLGVFSADTLPRTRKMAFSLIVNTDTSDQPGTHWQVIHVTRGKAYFFCSLGHKMNKYIKSYLKKYTTIATNRSPPQNASETTCGAYCIFVIKLLALGHSFEEICQFFDKIKHDDVIVRAFVEELCQITLE